MTETAKRQFCRKCLKNTVPAVTLTFRNGTRLHWCAEGAADAERYREPEPMTREELAAWLRLRGVDSEAWLAELLALYAGKTEDEMDDIYEGMHGLMA